MRKDAFDTIIQRDPFVRLGDAVYQVLYGSIISLDLEPGTVLSETALAKELEVSRTPIRNALLRLAGEGLLEETNGQPFTVAGFKQVECQQLMEARIAIEAQAAYWAAERISGRQLLALKTHMEAMSRAFDAWDVREMVSTDSAFHQTIVDAAGNAFLSALYRQLVPRVTHYRNYLYGRLPKDEIAPLMGASVRIHRSVYHAVRLGFANEARSCMERDVAGMTDMIGVWER